MSRKAFERAKELILEERYTEARGLLMMMKHDPIAQKWLAKLNKIAPQKPQIPYMPSERTSEIISGENDVKRNFLLFIALLLVFLSSITMFSFNMFHSTDSDAISEQIQDKCEDDSICEIVYELFSLPFYLVFCHSE